MFLSKKFARPIKYYLKEGANTSKMSDYIQLNRNAFNFWIKKVVLKRVCEICEQKIEERTLISKNKKLYHFECFVNKFGRRAFIDYFNE